MNQKIAVSHASSLAAEAILEKLPESGILPDSLVLLDDETNAGARQAYADTYLKSENQYEYDLNACSLLLMPQLDARLEQLALTEGCLLIGHELNQEGPAVLSCSHREPEVSYTDAWLRLPGLEVSCMLPAILALAEISPVRSAHVTMMRSAEFYGKQGVEELASQTISLLNAREAKAELFPQQLAFNLFPEMPDAGLLADFGHILGNNSYSNRLQMVTVPLFHGFVASIQLEFESDVSLESSIERLSKQPDVVIKDGMASPISDCNQSFSCVISHLEQPQDQASSLQFWMMADPMRYGLANNYVNVADFLLKSFL